MRDLTGSPPLPHYLVEWYQAGLTGDLLDQAAERIGHATRQAAADGSTVHLLLTLCVPDDDVAFCLFAATSAQAVAEVCGRARLPLDRITEALARDHRR